MDGNGATVVVYDKVIFDFQALLFQHIFNAGAVYESAVPVSQLTDGMVQRNEQASAFVQIFVQLLQLGSCVEFLGIDDADDIVLF